MRTQITVDWKDELYQELVRGTRESIRRGIALGVFDIHPLNRYFQRLIRQNVQQQRCLLTNASDFTELDHAGKRRLLTMIRHYINRAAIADMWSDFFLSFMRWINILVIVILCYFAFTGDYFPWFAPPLFSIDPAWPITYYFVLVLVANIGLLLSLLPTYMLKPMHPINLNLPLDLDVYINLSFHFWFNRGFMIGWYIGVATASAALYAVLAPIAETAPPFFRSQAFAGAVGGLGFLGGFLSIILVTALSVGRLFSLLNYAFERRKQRLYPEAAITLQLLKILTLVAKNPVMWGSLEMKCKLVTRLERVASCLQHDLPHRLQSDIATDNWFQQMGVQMATAMRALKPWVLMPKSDTREYFIVRITDAFVHAAIGEWDALARSEDKPQTRRERWYTRVVDVSGALVIAVLPLLGFWGIQQSPLAIPQPVAGYVTIGGLIWLVMTVLISLDSSFHAKLRLMEDVTQSVPFFGKWLGIGRKLS